MSSYFQVHLKVDAGLFAVCVFSWGIEGPEDKKRALELGFPELHLPKLEGYTHLVVTTINDQIVWFNACKIMSVAKIATEHQQRLLQMAACIDANLARFSLTDKGVRYLGQSSDQSA